MKYLIISLFLVITPLVAIKKIESKLKKTIQTFLSGLVF